MEEYAKVITTKDTMDKNAELLNDASFEVQMAYERGQFHLEDREKLMDIIEYLEMLRAKQVKRTY